MNVDQQGIWSFLHQNKTTETISESTFPCPRICIWCHSCILTHPESAHIFTYGYFDQLPKNSSEISLWYISWGGGGGVPRSNIEISLAFTHDNYFMIFLGQSGHWPENKWKNSATFKSNPLRGSGISIFELWGWQFHRVENLSGAKMPKNDLKIVTTIKKQWKRAFLQNFKKTLPAKPTHSPFSAAWIAENLEI